MIRRLLLLCALVALASESAYGVELGKLQLHSALNQRLNADVSLTNVQGLGTDEILPGLASPKEFARMGIDRPYSLTNLRFTVHQGQNGQMSIHITSTQPIVEPYLDFLLQVLWPNGRIVREYTVLLNPPVYGKSGIEKLQPATTQAPPATAPATPQPAPAQAQSSPAAPAAATPAPMTSQLGEGRVSNGTYGVTGSGDTLWNIAAKVRPNHSVSIQQTMLAIEHANPNDFIHGNINLLKAGRVLRIPDLEAMQRETVAAAVQQVKAQNAAFHAYKRGGSMPQINASPRHAGSSGQGVANAANGGGELRLLTAKSGRTGKANASGSSGKAASQQQLEDQLDTTRDELDKTKRANTDLSGQVSDLQNQITTLSHIVKLKDQQLAALRAAVQKMQKLSAANSAAAPTSTPARQSSLLTNPYVLIVLGLILIGGVAGGLIFMRRRRQDDDMAPEAFAEEAPAVSDVEEATETESEPEPAISLEQDEEELSPQTTDVISEAEIYIAYGRFPQAITFLQNAIEAEPTRADIRLKLLEVYAQTEEVDAFDRQLAELEALGDDNAMAEARAMRRQLPGGEAAGHETPALADGDEEDLSFDLDDLDAETEDTTLDLSNDLDLEEELDLDLDLDSQAEAESEPALSLDDADLDLDLAADSSEDDLIDLGLELDEEDALPEASLAGLDEAVQPDDNDEDDGTISLDEAELEGIDLDLELAQASEDDTASAADNALELSLDTEDGSDLATGSAVEGLELDDSELDLGSELSLGDDELDLGGELSLDDDDLDLGDEFSLDDEELDLDSELDLDDGTTERDLASSDSELALNPDDDDDAFELNLEDDAALDLSDADGLDLDDDDEFELNLDEDASTKLDLARAYIDMGDSDGARNVLQEVIDEGSDEEIQEANELLAKID